MDRDRHTGDAEEPPQADRRREIERCRPAGARRRQRCPAQGDTHRRTRGVETEKPPQLATPTFGLGLRAAAVGDLLHLHVEAEPASGKHGRTETEHDLFHAQPARAGRQGVREFVRQGRRDEEELDEEQVERAMPETRIRVRPNQRQPNDAQRHVEH